MKVHIACLAAAGALLLASCKTGSGGSSVKSGDEMPGMNDQAESVSGAVATCKDSSTEQFKTNLIIGTMLPSGKYPIQIKQLISGTTVSGIATGSGTVDSGSVQLTLKSAQSAFNNSTLNAKPVGQPYLAGFFTAHHASTPMQCNVFAATGSSLNCFPIGEEIACQYGYTSNGCGSGKQRCMTSAEAASSPNCFPIGEEIACPHGYTSTGCGPGKERCVASSEVGAGTSSGSPVTFSKFKQAAQSAVQGLENASGCSLTMNASTSTVTITITTDGRPTVSLSVTSTEQITGTTHSESDGSYEKTFRTQGGQLTIVNADDAYFRAALSSGGAAAECEVDF